MTFTPIIVGVGDYKNPSLSAADAQEPLQLIVESIHAAARDTLIASAFDTLDLLSQVDSIQVVRTWTWPYTDLPGLIAGKIGATPKHKVYSDHGGNQPAKLVDEAARRIAKGESKIAVVAGGEALASLGAYLKEKKQSPPWTAPEKDVASVFSPTSRELESNLGGAHGIGAPIQIYPLYENAFRAHRGQSIQDNHAESARLYGDFAKTAAQNPMSWSHGKPAETDESIATVTKRNRMICFPYPLLMNAFNTVNIAAACILTSAEHAQEIGIPLSQWIYPLGGAGTKDSPDFWRRPNFYTSPSIIKSIDAAFEVTGLMSKDIDIYDFYSCFPIVPKLACEHLGISITQPEKPISLLGGLTSFGGAGNNYSMHAITHMVHHLRSHRNHSETPSRVTGPLSNSKPKGQSTLTSHSPRTGLVLANGGTLTYQHVLILSSYPAKDLRAYPAANPLPAELNSETSPDVYGAVPPTISSKTNSNHVAPASSGKDQVKTIAVVVETYTIDYERDGTPLLGHIVGRVKGSAFGQRFVANHADEATLREMHQSSKPYTVDDEEWSGRKRRARHRAQRAGEKWVDEDEQLGEIVGREGFVWREKGSSNSDDDDDDDEDRRWLFAFAPASSPSEGAEDARAKL